MRERVDWFEVAPNGSLGRFPTDEGRRSSKRGRTLSGIDGKVSSPVPGLPFTSAQPGGTVAGGPSARARPSLLADRRPLTPPESYGRAFLGA